MSAPLLRDARPEDLPAVLGFVRALAAFEREPERCVLTAEALEAALFGAPRRCRAILAWEAGQAVGHVLSHDIFEPLTGTHGCHVMHLFVAEAHRGRGIGRALLAEVARRLSAEGGTHVTWGVRTWNEAARAFYRGLGAEEAPAVSVRMGLRGDALAMLARAA